MKHLLNIVTLSLISFAYSASASTSYMCNIGVFNTAQGEEVMRVRTNIELRQSDTPDILMGIWENDIISVAVTKGSNFLSLSAQSSDENQSMSTGASTLQSDYIALYGAISKNEEAIIDCNLLQE